MEAINNAMGAINNALNVKANEYRQQELLGSIVAAGIIGFGSKYVSQLPTKTIAAAALNGFGLAVSAKSLGTIYSNWSKTEGESATRKSAYKALLASALLMSGTTLLRATNFADTKFSAALLAASAGTAVLSEVGLKIVKAANTWNLETHIENERPGQEKAEEVREVLVKDHGEPDQDKIEEMDNIQIVELTQRDLPRQYCELQGKLYSFMNNKNFNQRCGNQRRDNQSLDKLSRFLDQTKAQSGDDLSRLLDQATKLEALRCLDRKANF